MTDVQQNRSWMWGILFIVMGLLNLAMYLYGGRTELHTLLTGVGFLLATPLGSQRFRSSDILGLGLGMLGLTLMAIGIFVR
jgi:hypothetical protein